MPKSAAELGPLDIRRMANLEGSGNKMVAVGGVVGLYLQITPNNAKTWILRIKIGTRRRDIGLGGFPTVTLAQARDKAREARAKIEDGIDPVEERKAVKARLAAAQARGLTFKDAVDRALGANLAHSKTKSTAANGATRWTAMRYRSLVSCQWTRFRFRTFYACSSRFGPPRPKRRCVCAPGSSRC